MDSRDFRLRRSRPIYVKEGRTLVPCGAPYFRPSLFLTCCLCRPLVASREAALQAQVARWARGPGADPTGVR